MQFSSHSPAPTGCSRQESQTVQQWRAPQLERGISQTSSRPALLPLSVDAKSITVIKRIHFTVSFPVSLNEVETGNTTIYEVSFQIPASVVSSQWYLVLDIRRWQGLPSITITLGMNRSFLYTRSLKPCQDNKVNNDMY